jgi:hypothetical protein
MLLPSTMPDRDLILVPAVRVDWRMPDGTVRRSIPTVTWIPTTTLDHDRMPVILDAADIGH